MNVINKQSAQLLNNKCFNYRKYIQSILTCSRQNKEKLNKITNNSNNI